MKYKKNLPLSTFFSSSGIEFYSDKVERVYQEYGYMSKEKERDLLYNYKVFGCEKSREILILYNIKLVVSIIKSYSSMIKNSELYNELLQEGIYGLVRALEMYDIKRVDENRFSTYAAIKIKHYVSSYVEQKMNLIKIPEQKFRKIGEILNKMRDENNTEDVSYVEMLVINATQIGDIGKCFKSSVKEIDDDGSVLDSYRVYDSNLVVKENIINSEEFNTLKNQKLLLELKLIVTLLHTDLKPQHIKYMIENNILFTECTVNDLINAYNNLNNTNIKEIHSINYFRVNMIKDVIEKSEYKEIIKSLILRIYEINKAMF